MSLLSALNQIDKKYAWSLLGFVLAVFFGGLSIYTEFLRDRRPQLLFETITDASVFDVREPVDVQIIYDGIDIRKAQQSLRVIVVRVINEGLDDILKAHYDEAAPLGLRVGNGRLLRAEVSAASNAYLKQSLEAMKYSAETATFAPTIIESGEWFAIRVLILHQEGLRPSIEPIGKVAGVREVRRVDSGELPVKPSFLSEVFSGRLWVQVVRMPAYFAVVMIGFIALAFMIFSPVTSIMDKREKRRRERHIEQFRSLTNLELSESDEYVFQQYLSGNLGFLWRVAQGKDTRDQFIDRLLSAESARLIEKEYLMIPAGIETTHRHFEEHAEHMVHSMIKAAFLVKGSDGHWEVDPGMKATLEEFWRFLEIKGAV
jgi:hypothetical protein